MKFKATQLHYADNLSTSEDESKREVWCVEMKGSNRYTREEAEALADRLNAAVEEPDFSLEQARNG